MYHYKFFTHLTEGEGAHHLANQVNQVFEPVNGVQLVHLYGYSGDQAEK